MELGGSEGATPPFSRIFRNFYKVAVFRVVLSNNPNDVHGTRLYSRQNFLQPPLSEFSGSTPVRVLLHLHLLWTRKTFQIIQIEDETYSTTNKCSVITINSYITACGVNKHHNHYTPDWLASVLSSSYWFLGPP